MLPSLASHLTSSQYSLLLYEFFLMESSTLSSCKHLFSILQKNGGELKCNYAEKKCNLYSNESLFCNVKATDWEYVDALLHTYSGEVDKYVHFLTADNKPSVGNKTKQHKPIQNSFGPIPERGTSVGIGRFSPAIDKRHSSK